MVWSNQIHMSHQSLWTDQIQPSSNEPAVVQDRSSMDSLGICRVHKIKNIFILFYFQCSLQIDCKGFLDQRMITKFTTQLTIKYQAAWGVEISCISVNDIRNNFKFHWQKDTKQKKIFIIFFHTNIYLFTNPPYWQVFPQQMHIESSLQIAHAPVLSISM